MDDQPTLAPRQKAFLRFMEMNALEFRDVERITGVGYSTLKAYATNPGQSMTDRVRDKLLNGFGLTDEQIFVDPQIIGEAAKKPKLNLIDNKLRKDRDTVEVLQLDVSFGMGGGAFYDEDVKAEPMKFSEAWLRQFTRAPVSQIFFASGFGDSMYPTIGDGDVVLVDTSVKEPRMRDQIWAINQYGMGMIKRLRGVADGYQILSDNPQVPPDMATDGSMQILGRVIAVVRKV